MPDVLPESLRDIAERQCGVVTAAQAYSGGLTRDIVRWRVVSGRWQPLHRGTYATFTGRPGRDAVLWAAVLRAGPGAVLSHYTAAELDRLTDRVTQVIHVTVPGSRRPAGIRGVAIHLSASLALARHPSRTPPRTRIEHTVLDLTELAGTFPDAHGWIARALGRRLTTVPGLQDALAGRARVRWRAELTQALAADRDGIHSGLEYRYARDVERRHELPRGRRQARARSAGRTVYRDVLYDQHNLAVELDGRAAHPGDTRWNDIGRDNAAAADGVITLRYGWREVSERPCHCAAEVARVLRQRGTAHSRPCSPDCPVPRSP